MKFVTCLPLFLLAVIAGCDAAPPPKTKTAPAKIAASPPPLKTAEAKPAPKRQRAPVEKEKVARLFQVPEISAGTKSYDPRAAGTGQAPAIRLLGFSRLDGQFRALVEVKGEVLTIEQGDVVEGAEVVAIDPEGVSFQFAGQRWSNRLFEKRAGEGPVITPANIARANPMPAPAPPPMNPAPPNPQ